MRSYFILSTHSLWYLSTVSPRRYCFEMFWSSLCGIKRQLPYATFLCCIGNRGWQSMWSDSPPGFVASELKVHAWGKSKKVLSILNKHQCRSCLVSRLMILARFASAFVFCRFNASGWIIIEISPIHLTENPLFAGFTTDTVPAYHRPNWRRWWSVFDIVPSR